MNFKISDICEINSSNISAKDNYEYINYLDTSNLTEGVIDSIQKLVIGEDKIPSRAKRKVKKNDILISTVRPNQKHYGILRKLRENLIVSTGFAVLSVNKDKVDAEYLYRFLTQDSVTNYLQAIGETSTSTYPSIKPSDIGNLDIKLPTLQEQKAIAKVLSDLDEKIETNNKINRTLEEMAQAIFKQWFVDFEFPNEEGKPYKSSGGEMVESELGMIPKGWNIKKLSELADMKNGVNYSREQEGIEVRVVNVRDFDGSLLVNDVKLDSIFLSDKQIEIYKLKKYDTVIVRSAKPGETLLVNDNNTKVYSGFTIRIRGNDYKKKIYIFYCVRNSIRQLENSSNGTIFKNLNQQLLGKLNIIDPSAKELEEYNNFINPIIEKIYRLNKENEKLISIRDTLIPKLMSGEIRVQLNN